MWSASIYKVCIVTVNWHPSTGLLNKDYVHLFMIICYFPLSFSLRARSLIYMYLYGMTQGKLVIQLLLCSTSKTMSKTIEQGRVVFPLF